MFNYVIWVHQKTYPSPQKATHRRRLQWLKIPVFIRLRSTSFNSSISSVLSPKIDCVDYFEDKIPKININSLELCSILSSVFQT